jgi:tryptophan-rich sensory protein
MVQLTKQKQVVGLVFWLLVTFTAAAIGGAASVEAGPFYTELIRPAWSPPPSIFGPVWTILYVLMGVAAWLVWRVGGFGAARFALALYLAQLAINALWSWLFFGWHLGGLAFADILLLGILLIATLISFWRIRPLAGVLLFPYLLWVSFASALNYSIWQLNPQVLGYSDSIQELSSGSTAGCTA